MRRIKQIDPRCCKKETTQNPKSHPTTAHSNLGMDASLEILPSAPTIYTPASLDSFQLHMIHEDPHKSQNFKKIINNSSMHHSSPQPRQNMITIDSTSQANLNPASTKEFLRGIYYSDKHQINVGKNYLMPSIRKHPCNP